MCTVTIVYDAFPIDGTPSTGSTLLGLVYNINVPSGDYIREVIPIGTGFGPCPSVGQYLFRARSMITGEVIGEARSNSCHNIVLKSSTNNCKPTQYKYDCINGSCISYFIYATRGIYDTLESCQANCSSSGGKSCNAPNICVPPDYCPPGMVCLPSEEFSRIEGLGVALNNSACG